MWVDSSGQSSGKKEDEALPSAAMTSYIAMRIVEAVEKDVSEREGLLCMTV